MASTTIPTRDAIDGLAFTEDGSTLVTGSRGGTLRAWTTENLVPLWTVDVGPGLGQVRVRDGFITFGAQQAGLIGDQTSMFGLAAMPQDPASFVAAARESTDAELTAAECAEFFDVLCE